MMVWVLGRARTDFEHLPSVKEKLASACTDWQDKSLGRQ
jgi:hypothetical protein